ncbi:isopenicillin N synthase family dioxygenase [Nannocystis bainbridge]|uniref:2-oxoglutarate and iron-dependent oxygenase domain-containing protein n=1 Tax=Nannocystis bainbridge TaxID=2995303 RepID=A0ABT5E3F4_9BACT|nr:2-oxoglutarate and iron-dependent oxygenase domain-containing protein [Nannocystis bainbridge]MDC0720397.1 2-oxoglutarate and iron-dependent oxygenase domain-containing protein [Nannocystis bainbridge]
MSALPVLDLSPLRHDPAAADALARAIAAACRDSGFFYVVGHGLDPTLLARLEALSRRFFAAADADKQALAMHHGGRAWRGWFPLGGELTSGQPDLKEGLYFGTELPADHPRVRAGVPLHGANLWPAWLPELRPVVLAVMAQLAEVAQLVLEGVARSLGLAPEWFRVHYTGGTGEPTQLFRIFHYPATPQPGWGVGEHTDYGLLTLLVQDDVGGLQVKTPRGWIDAPPLPGALVCNIGDMLDRLTGGWYRSTPHRVRASTARDRLSFPFFFDPAWDAEIVPLPRAADLPDDAAERWDSASVHAFRGTYGEYLLGKVARVFPALHAAVKAEM